MCTRLSQAGGPQCLAKQLTLSQPGCQIMPTKVLRAPQIFEPCDGPGVYNKTRQNYRLMRLPPAVRSLKMCWNLFQPNESQKKISKINWKMCQTSYKTIHYSVIPCLLIFYILGKWYVVIGN